jgi:hypothetical protein
MSELKSQAAAAYKSLQGAAQREWQIPIANTRSLQDVKGMHLPAYDRTQLNNDYVALINGATDGAASNGEVLALRLQLAVMAVEERAYRHRHMTLSRAICTAHGRCYGHGEGELFSPIGIEGDVATYIRSGLVGATA